MAKTKRITQTFGLNGAAFVLGIADPRKLLWLVMTKAKPLGDLPYIPNGDNSLLIRFTTGQIKVIEKRLKEANYVRYC